MGNAALIMAEKLQWPWVRPLEASPSCPSKHIATLRMRRAPQRAMLSLRAAIRAGTPRTGRKRVVCVGHRLASVCPLVRCLRPCSNKITWIHSFFTENNSELGVSLRSERSMLGATLDLSALPAASRHALRSPSGIVSYSTG